ncbi:MAG TPA: sterol desaturase family protein [Bacteroidia bacterium]|nr:sterol desaturase family protein [Bacteroidia bacterium]
MDIQANNNNGTRIFKNPFLEALTKTSPAITLSFYSSVALLLLILGIFLFRISVSLIVPVYLSGVIFWSFFEYIMHRYIFHINEHVRGTDRFQFIIHGIHHNHPKDEERVFMPPVPGALIATLLWGINYLLMRNYSFFFTAGMVTGYMIYAYIHYSVHNKPPYPPFRKLWQHHAMHHYRYPDKAFGVSSPLWDFVFGTMPPKENKKKIS